jgi:hypothetical protein
MSWITTIFREVFGLFVDDGSFALTIVAWVAAVGLIPARLGLAPQWVAPLLFVGLALILIESAARRARR